MHSGYFWIFAFLYFSIGGNHIEDTNVPHPECNIPILEEVVVIALWPAFEKDYLVSKCASEGDAEGEYGEGV